MNGAKLSVSNGCAGGIASPPSPPRDTGGAKGADAAILTTLKPRDNRPPQPGAGESTAASVRLERVQIDARGKVTADAGVALAVPPDGVPGLECGAFVELPKGRLAVEQSWE